MTFQQLRARRAGPGAETALLIGSWRGTGAGSPGIGKSYLSVRKSAILTRRSEALWDCGSKMAGKKNVLSSLAVYAEDSEPESDGEAGVETAGGAPGEARGGNWKGRIWCLLGMLLT